MKSELVLPDCRFEVASFGELVSDPSRVTMLLSLMDGRIRPATELARIAQVMPQTASFHLRRLVVGGILRVEQRGRHRYYRIAGDEVAEALEAVSLLSAARPPLAPRSPTHEALARARMCYRHLAGAVGVAWLAGLETSGYLTVGGGAFVLSKKGASWLRSTGLSTDELPSGKSCLDWTERRYHLGGPLGALLTEHLFTLKWIARHTQGRALRVTETGKRELVRQLGLPESVVQPLRVAP